jgi:parvulin-like peptidyl-prolyl isomerase
MSTLLEVGDRRLDHTDLLKLLTQYQLLPELLKEILIDQGIRDITLTPEEEISAQQQFYNRYQLTDDQQRQNWLAYHRMSPEQLTIRSLRHLKIAKFKQMTWGHGLEADFLQQKSQLDQFIYSLIRVENAELAQELYFRLQAGEQTFASLAPQYAEGKESQTSGLVGPVTAATLHPALAQMLSSSKPGQLWPPRRLGNWSVIIRLENYLPAQLNDAVRQQLLDRRFKAWMDQQLSTVQVPSTVGIAS